MLSSWRLPRSYFIFDDIFCAECEYECECECDKCWWKHWRNPQCWWKDTKYGLCYMKHVLPLHFRSYRIECYKIKYKRIESGWKWQKICYRHNERYIHVDKRLKKPQILHTTQKDNRDTFLHNKKKTNLNFDTSCKRQRGLWLCQEFDTIFSTIEWKFGFKKKKKIMLMKKKFNWCLISKITFFKAVFVCFYDSKLNDVIFFLSPTLLFISCMAFICWVHRD